MMSQKCILITIFLLVMVFGALFTYYYIANKNANEPQITNQASKSSETYPNQLPTSTSLFKTYTNTEFGFEFQYPQDLIIRENTFGSHYSKFNLQVEYWNKEGKYLSVFDVNTVLPEFADRTFLSVGATTSTVIVDGVSGIKYEYEFESLPEVAVVLPLGQYKVILGIGGSSKFYGHESTFNQILASFKFMK